MLLFIILYKVWPVRVRKGCLKDYYQNASFFWAFLVAQTVKNLPAIWETWVLSLGWEDPLEEGMATHSSILAWRIPRTAEPGGLQSMGLQRVRHGWIRTHALLRKEFSTSSLQSICNSILCSFSERHWGHSICWTRGVSERWVCFQGPI